jgi:methyl-accepting chemotaxis protein
MMLRNAGLGKRFFLPTLTCCAIAVCALCAVREVTYMREFERTLSGIQDSTMSLEREAAKALMAEMRVATERSLQSGEYDQFVSFAKQQHNQAIQEISFISAEGKVRLSSRNERLEQPVAADLWQQVQKATELTTIEEDSNFRMCYPLRADADMCRLRVDLQPGQLYGALLVEFSKDKVNNMLAQARTDMDQSTRKGIGLSVGLGVGALVVVSLTLLMLVIRPLVRSLRAAIDVLDERSDDLVRMSEQFTATSQQLASATSEQAASLEETSSTLEEVAAMTRTNADNCKQADDSSEKTKTTADEGGAVVKRLGEAMQGLSSANGQIGSITKLIEEIAFQTNLLALNAAVEAARAGEQGKGFAVVASEVRNLAQRASAAAKQISDLAANSSRRTQEGVQIASEVAQSLTVVQDGVKSVSGLIGSIAEASREQAHGVEQVNAAVSQMDKVTQQNAASAEESAAVAEELSDQAHTVKRMAKDLMALVVGASGVTQAVKTPVESGDTGWPAETAKRKQTTNRRNRPSAPARPGAAASTARAASSEKAPEENEEEAFASAQGR